ncbi:uncharacterized protein EAE98_006341 [Botrytis deweyae]|uniref:Clr5 domain-containing protein n=1 Tax=Botrytis deweyae TaxID=2478750 RepID=A0ABQ7IKN4_9HELO|nr:uncharacterized protein EAE98_006341 [Botrytis deweyae]KAF7926957.1 hypothetical protein EAE98_006341 [Botrytis deweyae]
MPHKGRRSKGVHPRIPKTNRKEVPDGVRQAIVRTAGVTTAQEEAAYWDHKFSERTIRYIRQRARDRDESNGTRGGARRPPLADISNVENRRTRGQQPLLGPREQQMLVSMVKATRSSRMLSADQHTSNWNKTHKKKIHVSTFWKVMYANRLSHTIPTKKPQLNAGHRKKRVVGATDLREILRKTPERVIFIDAATIRNFEEDTHRMWCTPEEYEHKDVKQASTSNLQYGCGQFFGGICLGKRPGPCTIYATETEEEKKEAKEELERLNQEYDPLHTLAFAGSQRQEEREYDLRGKKKPGPIASSTTYKKSVAYKRGNRDKGGVDWYRFFKGFLEPKLEP